MGDEIGMSGNFYVFMKKKRFLRLISASALCALFSAAFFPLRCAAGTGGAGTRIRGRGVEFVAPLPLEAGDAEAKSPGGAEKAAAGVLPGKAPEDSAEPGRGSEERARSGPRFTSSLSGEAGDSARAETGISPGAPPEGRAPFPAGADFSAVEMAAAVPGTGSGELRKRLAESAGGAEAPPGSEERRGTSEPEKRPGAPGAEKYAGAPPGTDRKTGAAGRGERTEGVKEDGKGREDLGEFEVTAYCACEKCCGKNAGGLTASGTKPRAGYTAAVDPGVIPLGSTLFIDGRSYCAEDTGKLVKGRIVDLFFDTHEEAVDYGRQTKKLYIKKE